MRAFALAALLLTGCATAGPLPGWVNQYAKDVCSERDNRGDCVREAMRRWRREACSESNEFIADDCPNGRPIY